MAGVHYGMQSAAHAANTAAIVQAVREDANDTTAELNVVAERQCTCADGTVTACNSLCASGKPVMYVRVEVSRNFATMMSYPFVANPMPLSREASIRVE